MDETQKILITIANYQIPAYQTTDEQIVLTRRQIGEVIDKTKATAQRFLKQNENELPATIKASIPERKGKIPLTLWLAALAYWQYEAGRGNKTAQDLLSAIDSQKPTDLDIKIIEEDSAPTENTPISTELDLSLIAEGIEVSARWMSEAGIDEKAIASWKLEQLKKQVPELMGIVSSAQQLIATESHSPTGMIVSQLASELSTQMGKKMTAAKVNQALHDLELQEWAKPGVNRERKLTQQGKKYGIALLTTSSEGWQGAQLRWFNSVIPVLIDYFQSENKE